MDNLVINPPQIDDNLKQIQKERRELININSNQRKLLSSIDLGNPEDYANYVDPANYDAFVQLYETANSENQKATTMNYFQYAAQNNIAVNVTTDASAHCRDVVPTLITPLPTIPASVQAINNTLLDLLVNVSKTVSSRADYESLVNTLNNYIISGGIYNKKSFWRPFYFNGTVVKQIVYDEQHPNHYVMNMPAVLHHVKSIRLTSLELKNTINNITERNNIITIQLRIKQQEDVEYDVPVELDTTYNLFNFILVKLDVGNYTIETLLAHMEEKMNDEVKNATVSQYGSVFKITFNKQTGKITIKCQRDDLEFHIKFYSELSSIQDVVDPATGNVLGKSHGIIHNFYNDLWYILGFPWPYVISSDGADAYFSELSNTVNIGTHSVFNSDHPDNDIFDRTKLPNDFDYIFNEQLHTHRVFKYPSFNNNYIYMNLNNYSSVKHINTHNHYSETLTQNIFAKITMDETEPGKLIKYKDKSNTVIFPHALDELEKLDITWYDQSGQLVDFNNTDHSFALEIIYYSNEIEENNHDTSMGFTDLTSFPDLLGRCD